MIDGLKLQQPSSTLRIITTTAELHAESPGRCRLTNNNPRLTADRDQGTTSSTRKEPRSKSWDVAASVASASRCQSLKEETPCRPKTAPCPILDNTAVPGETSKYSLLTDIVQSEYPRISPYGHFYDTKISITDSLLHPKLKSKTKFHTSSTY